MFWIIAYFRITALQSVREKLENIGVQAMTISECSGHGRQGGKTETYRGHEYKNTLVSKVRVEVAVSQGELKFALEAIQEGAITPVTGKIGDGKVFVFNLEECVRIRTGESGKNAI